MIDNIRHYVQGKEKSLSQCTDQEIDRIVDDYHFRDLVGFIKHLVRVIREQNHIIEGLEKFLIDDIIKESDHDRVE